MNFNPTIRFNLECMSVKEVPYDVESFAYGETFYLAVQDLINTLNQEDPEATGDWYKTYYYTCEEDGYFFYTEEDLEETEEEKE